MYREAFYKLIERHRRKDYSEGDIAIECDLLKVFDDLCTSRDSHAAATRDIISATDKEMAQLREEHAAQRQRDVDDGVRIGAELTKSGDKSLIACLTRANAVAKAIKPFIAGKEIHPDILKRADKYLSNGFIGLETDIQFTFADCIKARDTLAAYCKKEE